MEACLFGNRVPVERGASDYSSTSANDHGGVFEFPDERFVHIDSIHGTKTVSVRPTLAMPVAMRRDSPMIGRMSSFVLYQAKVPCSSKLWTPLRIR